MSADHSILAHLASKLTGDHELLATEGLTFILQQSTGARAALHSRLTRFAPGLPEDLRYVSELVGEDLERPDVVGLDSGNVPRVIIEGKFWAGLTHNQPLTYLRRLPDGEPGVLAFAVPEDRLEVLFREITFRVVEAGIPATEESIEPGLRVVRLADGPHRLLLITWPALLNMLEPVEGDRATGESIRQLESLCRAQDREAFLPIRPEEISSAEVARRTLNYVQLLNDTVERLKTAGVASTDGFIAQAQRDGHVRYLGLGNNLSAAAIAFSCDRWLKHGVSPLWLYPQPSLAAPTRKALKTLVLEPPRKIFDNGKVPEIPIPLLTGVEYDRIVDRCAAEITDLVARLDRVWETDTNTPAS